MDVPMALVFFVYGLAFFILGFAILLYPKKDSSFKFANDLWLLAVFGVLHGINEWIDMFLLLRKLEPLTIIRGFILPVSFLFLVQFGVKIIVGTKKKNSALKALPYVLFIVWALLTALSARWLLMGDILARYLIGVPGIFLTSYALFLKSSEFKETKLPGVHRNLMLVAGAFLFYGIFSGLIVPEADFFPAALFNHRVFLDTVGIPVQVFRTFCAIIATYGMTSLLGVFDYETKARVQQSEKLFSTIFDNARDGILLTDTESKRFHTGNRAICLMLGYSLDECKNLGVMDILPREDVTHVIDQFEKQSRGEITLASDIPVKRKDGGVFYADINASPITLAGKTYLMGIFRDITDRKNAQERNEIQLKRLAALRAIDLTINASLDLHVTLDVILNEVLSQLKVPAADILLHDRHLHVLEFAAGKGFLTKALQYTSLRIGESHAGRAAIERRIVHVQDLGEGGEEFRRSDLFKEEGFISYYAVPLIAKGEVKGVLEIFDRAALNPDRGWLDFLDALAGQSAIAIDNYAMFEKLQRSNTDLVLAYDATIEGWSRALDLRDKETEGHSRRVTEMSLRLARGMGVSREDRAHIRRGALLHDIGKMGIPDNILNKPGKLADAEWEIMRRHPQYAYELLSPVEFLRLALDIPYCHHERWDGKGYPRGLKGEQIPLSARIFSIADIFDALCSDRPYRPAWPKKKALEHISSLAGADLDPKLVEIFIRLEKEGAIRSAKN